MESHRCTSGHAGRPHGALRPTLAVPNSALVVQADARALRFKSAAACHTAQPANEADREPPPDPHILRVEPGSLLEFSCAWTTGCVHCEHLKDERLAAVGLVVPSRAIEDDRTLQHLGAELPVVAIKGQRSAADDEGDHPGTPHITLFTISRPLLHHFWGHVGRHPFLRRHREARLDHARGAEVRQLEQPARRLVSEHEIVGLDISVCNDRF